MNNKNGPRMFLMCFIAAVFLVSAVPSQAATDYPKGTIQIVIPFAPGGSTDIFWRSVGDAVARNIGGTIAFVNKAGGGGVAGISFVANSKPDGYTLATGNSDPLNISPLFTPDIPYDSDKDITYIAKAAFFPFAIIVRSESPFKSLEELVAFAKANPGKLKCGVAGVGTTPDMIIQMFNKDAGVQITPLPFSGGGDVVPNLLGGHIDLTVLSLAPVKSLYAAGRVRFLALMAPKRFAGFPDIPTIAEKGYKASNITTGIGLIGPKGLPRPIVTKWENALEKTVKDPKVLAIVNKLEGLAIDFKHGDDYRKEILTEYAGFKKIVATLPGAK